MYTLAHLSDIHLPTPPAPGLGALLNKRLLGYLSWRLRRSRIHRREVTEALERDLKAQAADHIAVTGDLTNISLPVEFQRAAEWLEGLGAPDRVSVIPGNHDAYVAVPWAQSWLLWAPYMASESEEANTRPPAGSADFPFVRRRGPIAIVGLNTALPTGPGLATGRVGERQMATLVDQLDELRREDLFRVVLIHHPPLEGATKPRKSLLDAEAFRHAIKAAGAELVLHGHDHRFEFGEVEGPDGPVPVFGVGAASAVAAHGKPPGQYHLYDIKRTDGGWGVGLRIREFDAISGQFGEADFRELELAR